MAELKSLAKDTVIYGVSSIVGRFLNYLLVPLYTAELAKEGGGYGVVTNVYALTALFLILLTYGMETGFFRFVNKGENNPQIVYSTSLLSVGGSSVLFILLCLLFLQPISGFLGYEAHPEYVAMMAVVVALDAFQCIPFAYLRYKKRPLKFAGIKLLFIISNITLNLFFLLGCPWLQDTFPASIDWFYDPTYQVGYIFIANLICTSLQMLAFLPELTGFKYHFDRVLWRRMLCYSFPILILGIAGILNQTVDKMIYPFLFDDHQQAMVQLGIYGAAAKVAMIMAMFLQAFRYAYEPFVFGQSKGAEKDQKRMYAMAMKYFLIFTLLAFLVVMFYLDLLKYIIHRDYWEGLRVIPIVMAAEIFMGIYFNLSFWYKLIDETRWGAYFSVAGCVIIVILNVIFVPRFGYIASAWAGLIGYAVVTVISYVVGQKKYPIAYDLKGMSFYVLLAVVLYGVAVWITIDSLILRLLFRSLLLVVFVICLIRRDLPLNQIPVVKRFVKR